jgi:hypothetical protein
MGHGEDVCNHKGEPIVQTVPPGCLYITSTVCGLTSYVNNKKLFEAFKNPANEDVWQNPDPLKLKKVLEGILDTSTIHIHRPGDTYVENMYYPTNNHLYETSMKWTLKVKNAKYYTLTESGLYRLSDVLKKNIQILPEIKFEKSTFLHKEGKVETEITDFKIKKEDFLSIFENAIFPKLTPTEKKADYYTSKEINAISTKHKAYVSDLMEKFPGIHFNFLCRYINPVCAKGALARRMESAEKFQTLPETFEKSVKLNKPETVQSLFETFVEKGKPVEMLSTYYKKLPPPVQASTRSLYEKQLIQSAKDQITNMFKVEDFGQVKTTLDTIHVIEPFLGEIEKICRAEAKKANGKKEYLLQECLEDLHERIHHIVDDKIVEIYDSEDDKQVESSLQKLDSFLQSLSLESITKLKSELPKMIFIGQSEIFDWQSFSDNNNDNNNNKSNGTNSNKPNNKNNQRKLHLANINLRLATILQKYGIEMPDPTKNYYNNNHNNKNNNNNNNHNNTKRNAANKKPGNQTAGQRKTGTRKTRKSKRKTN